MSQWRQRAKDAIRKAAKPHRGKSADDIEKAIRAAYTFGERTNHPYKIWLDEVNKTMVLIRQGVYFVDDVRGYWL